jgi:hypothetical protein
MSLTVTVRKNIPKPFAASYAVTVYSVVPETTVGHPVMAPEVRSIVNPTGKAGAIAKDTGDPVDATVNMTLSVFLTSTKEVDG